jgi:hypothetical protein
LEIKWSHSGLGQVSRVDVPTRGPCASPGTCRQYVGCWRVVMVKNPWVVLPHFRFFLLTRSWRVVKTSLIWLTICPSGT